MQKTKFLIRAIASAMLSLTLATLGDRVVQAGYTSLRHMTCVGSGPGRWIEKDLDIAVGRNVYRSIMNLNPSNGSASVTCRIRRDNSRPRYQALELGLGMLDRDEGTPPTTVNFYLDGQQRATRTLTPGQATFLSFDVLNVSNVAIETSCNTSADYCSRVYIFKAELEQIPSSRRPRN